MGTNSGRRRAVAATLRQAILGLVLLALGALSAAPARAAERPTPAEAAAIRAVIEHQLAAFRRDDGAAAFAHAAPAIQAQFGTPERFMRMVREGYPAVYRPRQVVFQELLVHDGRWVQPLLVTSHEGQVVVALYTMERQQDASWRVGGVVLLATAAQGA
jgi:hypothetical protein